MVFTPEKDALRRAVADLSAQGVDIIIAMTHMGLANDQLLARSVAGVDVIVGGHSHSLLANSADGADGPYPVVETSPSGEPVLLVTASFGGRLLGDRRNPESNAVMVQYFCRCLSGDFWFSYRH